MLAALPCAGLLLALHMYGIASGESSSSVPVSGPFFLMIGLCVTLSGVAWSRAEPLTERHEADYWASVNRSR